MNSSQIPLTQNEFLFIKQFLDKECNIKISENKFSTIESLLYPLLIEEKCSSFKELYELAIEDKTNKIKNKIISTLNKNNAYWDFKNKLYFQLKNKYIPKLINKMISNKLLVANIWSIFSSSGQHPYSIAIIILEEISKQKNLSYDNFKILATSCSSGDLFMGISGRYNKNQISLGLPENIIKKYFVKDKDIYQISDIVKNMITFKKISSIKQFIELPNFDLITGKNICPQFKRQDKDKLIKIVSEKSNNNYLLSNE